MRGRKLKRQRTQTDRQVEMKHGRGKEKKEMKNGSYKVLPNNTPGRKDIEKTRRNKEAHIKYKVIAV